MKESPLTAFYDHAGSVSYEIRVRGTLFLWGSAGVIANMTFDKPPLLHIRNNVFGEVISIGTRVAAGTETILGTLAPGECISISVQGISGVFATCALETTVGCAIK
jgi:hypothetical protein